MSAIISELTNKTFANCGGENEADELFGEDMNKRRRNNNSSKKPTPQSSSPTPLLIPLNRLICLNGGVPLVMFGGFWLPSWVASNWLALYNFPIRNDDILLFSFPKSGSHWLHRIVYLIENADESGNNTGVMQGCKDFTLETPRPLPFAPLMTSGGGGRRFITSHMPARLMPCNAFNGRVIYLYRDAKDTAILMFHHYRSFFQQQQINGGTFSQFVKRFVKGDIPFGPYPDHVNSFLQLKRQGKPILIVRYEDLKKNIRQSVAKITNFLGKTVDESTIERISVEAGNSRNLLIFDSNSESDMTADSDYDDWADIIKKKRIVDFNFDVDVLRRDQVEAWQDYFTDLTLLAYFNRYVAVNHLPEQ